jgi:hypothetical protein
VVTRSTQSTAIRPASNTYTTRYRPTRSRHLPPGEGIRGGSRIGTMGGGGEQVRHRRWPFGCCSRSNRSDCDEVDRGCDPERAAHCFEGVECRGGHVLSELLERGQRCRLHMSPRGGRVTSLGAVLLDDLLDLGACCLVIDRLDFAALKVGSNQFQLLPQPIHLQQGLGLVKDPLVICHGLGHDPRLAPGRMPGRYTWRGQATAELTTAALRNGCRPGWSPCSSLLVQVITHYHPVALPDRRLSGQPSPSARRRLGQCYLACRLRRCRSIRSSPGTTSKAGRGRQDRNLAAGHLGGGGWRTWLAIWNSAPSSLLSNSALRSWRRLSVSGVTCTDNRSRLHRISDPGAGCVRRIIICKHISKITTVSLR